MSKSEWLVSMKKKRPAKLGEYRGKNEVCIPFVLVFCTQNSGRAEVNKSWSH